MLNRASLFNALRTRLFGGTVHQNQVDGIGKILDEWERRGLTDLRWLAYMLATVFHETATQMQPIREMGSESYLRSKPYWPWVGMGLVQVTWESNGRKFGATYPEDLLSWPVALRALFDGMLQGMFAKDAQGRPQTLARYFNPSTSDPVGARRIINGTDKAALIAGYHGTIHTALLLAAGAPAPGAPAPGIITPADKPPIRRTEPVKPPKKVTPKIGSATAAGGAIVVAAGTAAQTGHHAIAWVLAIVAVAALATALVLHFRK